ncbi:hypothetical protein, partial [Chryseobacterium piscicola]|uniref:hypothetical protein n=1 Tax=Chryseobacterium piscicola TaxID=551459 RepID=UPI0013566A91
VYLMMLHIPGIARSQMFFKSLEDSISEDNPVRFIDAFVKKEHKCFWAKRSNKLQKIRDATKRHKKSSPSKKLLFYPKF